MTIQVKETLRATIVLCIIVKISTVDNYVHYTIDGNRRLCLPYLNCEPGHEIHPCTIEYKQDICTLCPNGLKQPDLISSSPKGNPSDTKCFAPFKKCDSDEIKYSRSKKSVFCDSLVGCECDTTKCYYGDPCLCDDKITECGIGEYLNKTGGCVNCTEGTEKAEKGCGPCRRFKYISYRDSKGVQEVQSSTKRTTTQLIKLSLSLSTPSQSSLVSVYPQHNDELDDTAMIIIVVILGVAVVVLIIVAAYMWRTREQCMCSFKMCLNHGHHDPAVRLREQIPLNQVENGNQVEKGDIQETVDNRTTEGGKPTATPTDNRNSEIYRDQASSNQCEYQKDNSNTNTSEQCHNNNSVSRSSKSPQVESVTGKCTTDKNLASGRYMTMNA
ncbi:uncharacterized protein LOC134693100 [Mytilus trossulus]|uniref:uncharacterized protein LOC134693100 n=1 Tax=Mytilus trossulus TaxID=6551 RepID=UPI003003D734